MINKEKKTRIVNFRVTETLYEKIIIDIDKRGMETVSQYLTWLLKKRLNKEK